MHWLYFDNFDKEFIWKLSVEQSRVIIWKFDSEPRSRLFVSIRTYAYFVAFTSSFKEYRFQEIQQRGNVKVTLYQTSLRSVISTLSIAFFEVRAEVPGVLLSLCVCGFSMSILLTFFFLSLSCLTENWIFDVGNGDVLDSGIEE